MSDIRKTRYGAGVTLFSDAIGLADSSSNPVRAMSGVGIVQRGAPILERPAGRVALPDRTDGIRSLLDQLAATADLVERLHAFANGMGLAAPQIGVDAAVALVRPPADAQPIALVNPRVVATSNEVEVLYEGCLSFFDVRGEVARPRWIVVEHETLAGTAVQTTFRDGVARLVMHEVDHLEGKLYVDRMPGAADLIGVEEYRARRTNWYSANSPSRPASAPDAPG